jgi:integrase
MGRVRGPLDPNEVKRLTKAAKKDRKGVRDALVIYQTEVHGYPANELVKLKRSAIDLERHIYTSHDQRAASIQHMLWIAMRRVPWVRCSKMPPRAPSCSSASAGRRYGGRVSKPR